MKRICVIQWLDKNGNKTPDNNLAVGYCYIEQHIDTAGRYREETPHYPICEKHLAVFNSEHLRAFHWQYEPYYSPSMSEQDFNFMIGATTYE